MRVRSHITSGEAHCRCGCLIISGAEWLDITNFLIISCGFSIPITTMVRCIAYNRKVGGVTDSPHLPQDRSELGASDFRCRSPVKRMVIISSIMNLVHMGFVNQVEIADSHIHMACVKRGHRLNNLFNYGKSK